MAVGSSLVYSWEVWGVICLVLWVIAFWLAKLRAEDEIRFERGMKPKHDISTPPGAERIGLILIQGIVSLFFLAIALWTGGNTWLAIGGWLVSVLVVAGVYSVSLVVYSDYYRRREEEAEDVWPITTS